MHRGTAVHAAAFIRARKIVLEESLFEDPSKLCLIFSHETFHFVWARLGNRLRSDFAAILSQEFSSGARGELGESSGEKKLAIGQERFLSHAWRDYVCESFCDTAAWRYSGLEQHSDFTLARCWRETRRRFLDEKFSQPRAC
jgi:hypothetical protein